MTASVFFFELPSVRALIHHVVTDLVEGKSVIVLLPHTACVRSVRDRIAGELERRRFDDFDRFDTAGNDGIPEGLLCSEFCQNASGLMPDERIARLQSSARNYYRSGHEQDHELPAVLFLERLDDASAVNQDRWIAFLDRWQETTRANRNTERAPCRFCVVADATRLNKVPREDVFMTIVYWWGVPSELEMELFCRGLFPSDGNRITLEERWRGTLLPVLAGGILGSSKSCAPDPQRIRSHSSRFYRTTA